MSHISSVVYEDKCNCGENFIAETGRNVTIRWDEHSDIGNFKLKLKFKASKASLSVS